MWKKKRKKTRNIDSMFADDIFDMKNGQLAVCYHSNIINSKLIHIFGTKTSPRKSFIQIYMNQSLKYDFFLFGISRIRVDHVYIILRMFIR